jgi:tetratricopeptide (TPR) repeat protein
MQESASFWTDIKTLGEQLAKTPDSLCFARLSEVYLKVGLIDDALHVARQGVLQHPRFLSGQRVLALACNAKELHEEAISALLLVTEAVPEDIVSQKLLGRLLAESGNYEEACQVFRTVLEFAPDDMECRIELESLERLEPLEHSQLDTDDEIIEDLEILEEIDVFEEDEPEEEQPEVEQPEIDLEFQDAPPESVPVVSQHHDPLSTSTLAELYVSQGFVHKAVEIYRTILAVNPADPVTSARIAELEALDSGTVESVETASEYESQQTAVAPVWQQSSSVPVVPQQGIADNALATFDGWLENIRRIKSCR